MSHNYQRQQKQKLGYNYNACYIAKDLDCNNMIVSNKIYQENFIRLIQAKKYLKMIILKEYFTFEIKEKVGVILNGFK